MLNIVIVEDDVGSSKHIKDCILQFSKDVSIDVIINAFFDGASFIEHFNSNVVDILFMDINLPDSNGMQLCEYIRGKSSTAEIIFVTDMIQFAVKGYKVDALDFIVKPVTYSALKQAIERAVAKRQKNGGVELCLRTKTSVVNMAIADIYYIEVINHTLIYHTAKGKHVVYGQLKNIEKMLFENGFIKCNRFYLVNAAHIESVSGFSLNVNGTSLQISTRKKKEVLQAIARFYGGN